MKTIFKKISILSLLLGVAVGLSFYHAIDDKHSVMSKKIFMNYGLLDSQIRWSNKKGLGVR